MPSHEDQPASALERRLTRRGTVKLVTLGLSSVVIGPLLAACGEAGETASGGDTSPTATTALASADPTPTSAPTTETAGTGESTPQAEGEPIRLGILLPFTGVYAQPAADVERGVMVYLKGIGNEIAGRPVTVIREDSEADPATGITKARKLIERDRVDVMIGPLSSAVGTAVRDLVVSSGIPQIYPIPGTLEESGTPPAPNIFRVSYSPAQLGVASARYLYETLGYRTMAIMCPDYVWGQKVAEAFKSSFEELGGTIADVTFTPLDTTDFAPYLGRVDPASLDAMWVFYSGGDAIRFVVQYGEMGLTSDLPLTGAGDVVDEAFLPSQGDAALGFVSFLPYTPSLENDANAAFVNAYQTEYDAAPGFFNEIGWVAAAIVDEAIRAVDGDVSDKAKLAAAMEQVEFDSPHGRFRFDMNRFPILDMQVRRVELDDSGEYVNTIIDVIEGIDSNGMIGG